MGIFSNNIPEDLKDKDEKAIVNMSPSDIDTDFFTKYKDNEIMKGFSEEKKAAIQFLIDLKGDKYELFMRMGKKSTPAPAPAAPAANKGTNRHMPPPPPAEKMNKTPTLRLKIPLTPRTAIPLEQIQNGGRRHKKKKGGKKTQKALIQKIKTAKINRMMAAARFA
jgi:hypothetical protein